MDEEQRAEVIRHLRAGEDLSPEWSRILFPPEKREYELQYYGKDREEDVIAGTLAVPLQKVRTFGDNGDGWVNQLIFGDNLQIMKSLLKAKTEGTLCNGDGTPGVRLVYIDPPFATKQDFRSNKQEKAYQDKVAGAEFVEFVRRRLILLRELLSDDGSIFLHADHRKVHYLKIVMDEVFGEQNFRNEIVLPGRASKNLQQQFDTITRLNVRHDTLLWYSKKPSTRYSPLWVEKHAKGNPEGHWHHFWSTADRKTMRYELFGITPETGQWTWQEKRALAAVANYQRYLKEGGGRTLAQYWRDTGKKLEFIRQDPDEGKPQYWRAPADLRLADTAWTGVPVYSARHKYPTEKNEALLSEILELGSKPGDLVMDTFMGSGTTVAVAEKKGRRWVGVDCGKLSIYTAQMRLLEIQNHVDTTEKAKPFALYNAGLYDFSQLKDLPHDAWRFFSLQLFQCRDQPHKIGGIELDGYLKGSSVLVFDHQKEKGARIDETTIASLHEALGEKIGGRLFIVAPALAFDFQQDYVEVEGTRYYALRIPYSIIHELHRREFTALRQPDAENAVNSIVDAVGFDFVRTPEVAFKATREAGNGVLKITTFKSEASLGDPSLKKANLETLSMVMLDYDFDLESDVFSLDSIFYADDLSKNDWRLRFPLDEVGEHVMVVFIDIYGNEARELIPGNVLIDGKPPRQAGRSSGSRAANKRSQRTTAGTRASGAVAAKVSKQTTSKKREKPSASSPRKGSAARTSAKRSGANTSAVKDPVAKKRLPKQPDPKKSAAKKPRDGKATKKPSKGTRPKKSPKVRSATEGPAAKKSTSKGAPQRKAKRQGAEKSATKRVTTKRPPTKKTTTKRPSAPKSAKGASPRKSRAPSASPSSRPRRSSR